MRRRIDVDRVEGDVDPERFAVRVNGHGYDVSVSAAYKAELAPTAESAELVSESFAFLLEREPADAILARFDLRVIERYFPEYRTEIARRLIR